MWEDWNNHNNPYQETTVSIQNPSVVKSSQVKKTRFSIAWRILEIIENWTWWEIDENETFKIEKYMKRYIKSNLKNIEQLDLAPIFNKYFNDDKNIDSNTFDSKFNKYFPIHFTELVNYIKWKLLPLTKKVSKNNQLEKEKLIKKILNKYLYILFIFWEKIPLSELLTNIEKDTENLIEFYISVLENIEKINHLETKQIKQLKNESKISKLYDKESKNSEKSIIDDPFCSTMYRNAFKRIKPNWDINKDEDKMYKDEISEKIEELYKLEFRKLFTAFEKWYGSDWNFWDNMHYLEDSIKKILWSIVIFKNLNIAFTENFSYNIKEKKILHDVNTKLIEWNIIGWSKNKNTNQKLEIFFKEFIEMSVNNLEIGDFLDFIKKLNILKKKTAESKIPEHLPYINKKDINIKTIDFDNWNNIHESQKYDLLFSKIISNNWILNISKHLQLETIDNDLVFLFTENYWLEYNVVLSQFQEIKWLSKSWITLSKFVENDINNLNLLVIWWEFLLKIRKLKKWNNNEITAIDIKKIKKKSYWLIEKISDLLNKNKIFDKKNIHKLRFTPEWKLNNISVKTIPKQLVDIFEWFKKWPIELDKKEIQAWNKTILIKDIIDLYIPKKISNKWKNIDINNLLNIWIDLCYNLVQWKPITENSQKIYLKTLQKHHIIPKNVKKLNIKNKDNILNLVETLKFIKDHINPLEEMIKKGNQDKEKLIELFWPILNKNKWKIVKDYFWPNKSFIRAFTKLIKLYSWDFTLIWDLTRLRIVKNDIDWLENSIINFVSFAVNKDEITHVSIRDKIWEPISDPEKDSWYKDITVFYTLKSWNVVEQQFLTKNMSNAKENWIDLTNKENFHVFDKLRKEKKLFKLNEMKKFINFAQRKNIELPTLDIMNRLLEKWSIYKLIDDLWIDQKIFSIKEISCTYTYNITRQLIKDSKLWKNLTRLERTIYDNASSWDILNYLENKWVKTE